MHIITLLVYAICAVMGVTCFKLGSNISPLVIEFSKQQFAFKINYLSILGMVLYVISFLIYLSLVSKNDLVYLTPVSSGLVYILTLIVSLLVFKEQLTLYQGLGWLLILSGVMLMNLKK